LELGQVRVPKKKKKVKSHRTLRGGTGTSRPAQHQQRTNPPQKKYQGLMVRIKRERGNH